MARTPGKAAGSPDGTARKAAASASKRAASVKKAAAATPKQKAATRKAARAVAEAAPVVEAVPEVEQPAKPVGLSSKAMSRQSRGKQSGAGGGVPRTKLPEKKQALLRYSHALPKWPGSAEMLSLRFELRPLADAEIYPQYSVGLHAWFLKQVQQDDAELSRRLHDHADEKAFTLSALDGPLVHVGDKIRLAAAQTYVLTLTVFSKAVVKWLARWLKQMPGVLELKFAP
ncbi:MAG: hypothetical protein HC824_11370, partial [Synechococcales cyanobacterium RM1_1_8]|nr:hypothetical protein [Synechococcales cyanobacterium RM1_1_8]